MFFLYSLEVNGMTALIVLAVDWDFAISTALHCRIVMNHCTHFRFKLSLCLSSALTQAPCPTVQASIRLWKTAVEKGIAFFPLPCLPLLLLGHFLGATGWIFCSRCCFHGNGSFEVAGPQMLMFSYRETFISFLFVCLFSKDHLYFHLLKASQCLMS